MVTARRPEVDRAADELGHAVAVGSVDARSARIWMRAPGFGPGSLQLVLLLPDGSDQHAAIDRAPIPEADHTLAVTYPDDFPGAPPLLPRTMYGFRIQGRQQGEGPAGKVIGEGRFETAPAGPDDTPERFCFAFTSCHQPFDSKGRPDEAALDMLQAANHALTTHDAKFLLMLGDQVYADEPPIYSVHGEAHDDDKLASDLLAAPAGDIRGVYHRQYRRSWGVPGFMQLQAQRSTHCTMDDHEIVDNWGSDPVHAGPDWQRVAGSALDAFFDYQGARSWPGHDGRPRRLHRWFGYGTVAVFLMDIRSERSAVKGQEQIVSEEQLGALQEFLRLNADRHAVFVVVGVPIVHIPGWLNAVGDKLIHRGSDIHDRWSIPSLLPQRDRLLRLLADHQLAHPRQKLAVLSGDIHAGWGSTLRPPGGKPITQFVASALTNHNSSMAGTLQRALLEVTRPLEKEVAGLMVANLPILPGGTNPYGGLNLGLVEVEKLPGDPSRSRLRFKLIGQDPAEPSRPKVIFESVPFEE